MALNKYDHLAADLIKKLKEQYNELLNKSSIEKPKMLVLKALDIASRLTKDPREQKLIINKTLSLLRLKSNFPNIGSWAIYDNAREKFIAGFEIGKDNFPDNALIAQMKGPEDAIHAIKDLETVNKLLDLEANFSIVAMLPRGIQIYF